MKGFMEFLTEQKKVINEGVEYSYNSHQREITVTDGKKTYTVRIDSDGDIYSNKSGSSQNMEKEADIYKVLYGVAKIDGKETDNHFWECAVNNLTASNAAKVLKLCATEITTCKKFLLSGQYKSHYPDKLSMENYDEPDVKEILDSGNVFLTINDESELVCITDRQNWNVEYDIRKSKV